MFKFDGNLRNNCIEEKMSINCVTVFGIMHVTV